MLQMLRVSNSLPLTDLLTLWVHSDNLRNNWFSFKQDNFFYGNIYAKENISSVSLKKCPTNPNFKYPFDVEAQLIRDISYLTFNLGMQ